MKTVSTKLSRDDFEKFQEVCNNDGQCLSEGLRELIKMSIEAFDDELESESVEELEPEIVTNETIMTHGKILDDYGNVIGTF